MGLFLLGRPRHIQYVNSIYAPRGGDCGRLWKTLPIRYFNPRPRMGGDPAFIILSLEQAISIHAPRMGGDSCIESMGFLLSAFQSTPPAWGATRTLLVLPTGCGFQSTPPAWGATTSRKRSSSSCKISIHAPRMGGDCLIGGEPPKAQHFNPRPPHGGRPVLTRKASSLSQFQSTPPAWGATWPHSLAG